MLRTHPFVGAKIKERGNRRRNQNEQNTSNFAKKFAPSRVCCALRDQFSLTSSVSATSRIKDIANFEGVRDNLLVGYGLVVGLNNTGDTLADGHFTKQSLLAMLERLGVKPTENGLSSKMLQRLWLQPLCQVLPAKVAELM